MGRMMSQSNFCLSKGKHYTKPTCPPELSQIPRLNAWAGFCGRSSPPSPGSATNSKWQLPPLLWACCLTCRVRGLDYDNKFFKVPSALKHQDSMQMTRITLFTQWPQAGTTPNHMSITKSTPGTAKSQLHEGKGKPGEGKVALWVSVVMSVLQISSSYTFWP